MGTGALLRRREALVAMGAGLGAVWAIEALWNPFEAEGAGCLLQRETTEGPFHLDLDGLRRDITGNRRGEPLALGFTVVDAATCAPVPGAVVEVWHADASGRYSGVEGVGGRWLRGAQRTDARGRVSFATIVPGWYPGRTPHIHVKVVLGERELHTGQVFFRSGDLRAVYARGAYARRGRPDVGNERDFIAREAGARSVMALTRGGRGLRGRLTLGVDRG